MRKVLWLLGLSAATYSCNSKPSPLTERGILVLGQARNCLSTDYFIPCEINDTIPLGKIVSQTHVHTARSVNANQFQFALMRTSWESAADSFYVQRKDFTKQYISAVEVTLERDLDTPATTTPEVRIAGSILVNQLYAGHYRIISVNKIILPE